MFVDASVIVAILGQEAGYEKLAARLDAPGERFVSAIVIWESTRGLHRSFRMPLETAEQLVKSLVAAMAAEVVAIDASIGDEAVRATMLYGRGSHKAALNMGDCFAYACARTLDVPLLCKGNDFPQTDIRLA